MTGPSRLLRFTTIALTALSFYILYFYGIADAGLLGPDEPRYASIARQMASSGDWITPRLWGEPWFEKPPLTYWLAALGWRAGLDDDWAPRTGIALLSTGFLGLFWGILRREFGAHAARYSTMILATTAGWLAFSQLCVTDLPLSACFGSALLFCLRWLRTGETRELPLAGVSLGLAALAKGLAPVVLFAPTVVFATAAHFRPWNSSKTRSALWRSWGLASAAFLVVAAPWYILAGFRHGAAFYRELIWKHHFERFTSDALQHLQPWWFYLPVLAAGFLPWTPLLVLLRHGVWKHDRRLMFLMATVTFGLLFFSLSRNKLPGYLLPLFPPLAALTGVALCRARAAHFPLALSAALAAAAVPAGLLLPGALSHGLSEAELGRLPWWVLPLALLLGSSVWLIEAADKRALGAGVVFVSSVVGVWHLKHDTYPTLDELVSARGLWKRVKPIASQVCIGSVHRNFRYGLNYYSGAVLPDCSSVRRRLRMEGIDGRVPELVENWELETQ